MPIPDTFDAAVMPAAGADSEVSKRSLAPLEAHEVGIKINSTAINPIDWKIRDWRFLITEFPGVNGADAAGEIVEIGSQVTGLSIGDRVFFQGVHGKNDAATFQQYCKMEYKLVGLIPDSVDDDRASTIPTATMAALTALYDSTGAGITPPWTQGGEKAGAGKGVVIIGGSSSVGQYAIQLARLSGFTKIVTNSSAEHISNLQKLGATTVLDRSHADVNHFVSALGETPLAVVFDTISIPPTDILSVKIAQAVGRADSPRVVARVNPMHVDEEAKKLAENEPKVELKGINGTSSLPTLRHISESGLKWLGGSSGKLATGEFVPNEALVVPGGLSAVNEAMEKNKAGVSGVKVVVRPFGP